MAKIYFILAGFYQLYHALPCCDIGMELLTEHGSVDFS